VIDLGPTVWRPRRLSDAVLAGGDLQGRCQQGGRRRVVDKGRLLKERVPGDRSDDTVGIQASAGLKELHRALSPGGEDSIERQGAAPHIVEPLLDLLDDVGA
jgi:hypothetical protein